MAEVFRSVRGGPIQKVLANDPGVQAELDAFIFEAEVRAEETLTRARLRSEAIGRRIDNHVKVESHKGRTDRYLVLNDDAGQGAAMSIEFGRKAYEYEGEDGEIKRLEGMEGLGILHAGVGVRLGSLKGTGGGALT